MKIITIILLTVLSTSTFGKDKELTLKVNNETWKLVSRDGALVSENCLKSSCEALKKISHYVEPKSNTAWANHPAATFCTTNAGEYFVGVHPNGNEDGICRFEDKSFILGWDFFNRSLKQKKAE